MFESIEGDEILVLRVCNSKGPFFIRREGNLKQIMKEMLKHSAFAAEGIIYKIYFVGEAEPFIEIKRDELGF